VFYDATRKLVLNGADGVVFVADSQPAARDSDLESMENLAVNLAELGIELARFPLVVQYNKRDLAGAMPVSRMRSDLNPRGVPEFETVASRGDNIMAALKEITRLVIADIKTRQPQHAPAPAPAPAGNRPEGIAHELEAAAEALPTPAPAVVLPRPDRGARLDLSFARLFPGAGTEVAEVEMAIRDRTYGVAVRTAAQAVAELLQSLPVSDEAPTARAALLGLDGAEYLRLCRLAGKPDQGLGEREALFALYLLVAARLKAERT